MFARLRRGGVRKAFVWVVLAYLAAGAAAWIVEGVCDRAGWPEIPAAFAADVAATVAVFAFSFGFRNSSFYDPYWSVVPPLILLYYAVHPAVDGVDGLRVMIVLALVLAWAVRLTFNWARGWQGLGHEDWRYTGLREQWGRRYWLISFLGIHLMPTIWVFLGCLSLYPAVSSGTQPLGALDVVATVATAGAIWIEKRADDELVRFRREGRGAQAILDSGLWAWSRHPNYFGEMGFWWGLWIFGVAADPASWWWTLAGPVSITLMFRFVSLPMIETRMQERRPGWAAHAGRTPLVIPRPPKRAAG
jgi:steroid 5-alpha reductase family enzyme